MKKMLATTAAALLAGSSMASLVSYEYAITNSGGTGPSLWFKNATTKSGEHVSNSGSSGAANIAYRLAGALYTDVWGNENMAFGATNATAPAVAGSTGLFTTGAQGTISFLFNTGSSIGAADQLFSQGTSFAVKLIGPSSTLRIDHNNGGTKYSNVVSVATDTWYYFAMKWDTTKPSNDLTWYLGAANGSLQSGNLTITSAGENTSIGLDQSKKPMQEIAIWERELSDEAIQAQFTAAIPEPATLGLFGTAAAAVLFLRRMTR